MIGAISLPAEQRTRLLEAVLIFVGATAVAGFVLVPKAGLLSLAGCAALALLAVVAEVFRGRIDGILLLWAAFFPLGSFAMFPKEHSIVTLERVVLLLACIGLCLAKPGTLITMPRALRRVGLACLLFMAVAAATLAKSPDVLNPARTLFGSFLVPLLFGWCVIAWFDVQGRLPALHTAVCISSIICTAIAAGEIVTGEDLLPVQNSTMFYTAGIARPNGPFAANDQLALVGGLSFFFLLFLRVALGPKLSLGRRVLHAIGLAAAFSMALMPMFRSIAIAFLLALIIDTFRERRTRRRAWRIALILVSVSLILIASVLAPDVFEDRSSSGNVYARVAQYEQSLKVFADHPVLGVGFSNFNNFVTGESRYVRSYEGVSAVDWPHSNLAQALAETGILGFVPYAMTHIFLFMAAWQLRRSSSPGNLVWKYLLYMFLAYWITGLTESSGFEFLNVWYVFVITACYKYGWTARDSILFAEAEETTRSGFLVTSI